MDHGAAREGDAEEGQLQQRRGLAVRVEAVRRHHVPVVLGVVAEEDDGGVDAAQAVELRRRVRSPAGPLVVRPRQAGDEAREQGPEQQPRRRRHGPAVGEPHLLTDLAHRRLDSFSFLFLQAAVKSEKTRVYFRHG